MTFNAAIAVTLLRFLLAPVFVWLLLTQSYTYALWVFLVASLSDALDGFLARHCALATPLGALLDPLADKLLVACGILAMSWVGALPLWLAGIVLLRDVVIVCGAAAYRFITGDIEMAPLILGKINTAAQFVLVLAALFAHSTTFAKNSWLDALVWIVLTTTLASGIQYVWVWSRKVIRRRN
ncbi:MAG: CDP-alcohol phosphatidyltransferase family protein [Methylophilaceae bacterium]|nr:CDP-alcohol phosphatidyltransferase family protein [Methylophilaceae bacterium]